MRKLIEDYYAAITWLHLDFAVGVDDNLAYMNELTEGFIKTGIYDVLVDTLDMAWEKSEASGDFSTFERALTRVLKEMTNA